MYMHCTFCENGPRGRGTPRACRQRGWSARLKATVYRYMCFGLGLVYFYVALGDQMSMLRGAGTGARKTVLAAAAAALPVVAVELEEPPTP